MSEDTSTTAANLGDGDSRTSNTSQNSEVPLALQGRSDDETDSNVERHNLAYQAFLSGWLANKLERDKSILTLAGGGVALAVSLITTIGPDSISMLALFIAALISFLICLITLVFTFDENANYLSQVIKELPPDKRLLTLLNRIGLWSMLIGSILLSIAGGMAGYTKLEDFKRTHEKPTQAQEPNTSPLGTQNPQPPSISINIGGTENHVSLAGPTATKIKTKTPCPESNTKNPKESDIEK